MQKNLLSKITLVVGICIALATLPTYAQFGKLKDKILKKDKNKDKDELPADFSYTGKSFKDLKLSHPNISKMFKEEEESCAEILKVHTHLYTNNEGGTDWYINRNDVGFPISKIANGSIGIIFKGKDGLCYYVNRLIFFQTYEGGGKYAPMALSKRYEIKKISCEKAQ